MMNQSKFLGHLTLLLYIAAIALESKLNKVRIPERLVRIIALQSSEILRSRYGNFETG